MRFLICCLIIFLCISCKRHGYNNADYIIVQLVNKEISHISIKLNNERFKLNSDKSKSIKLEIKKEYLLIINIEDDISKEWCAVTIKPKELIDYRMAMLKKNKISNDTIEKMMQNEFVFDIDFLELDSLFKPERLNK